MGKIKITQVRSTIGRSKKQKDTMLALGLKKMHQTVEKEDSPIIKGMIDKISHLVKIES
jgi:large subunit ribosomal protein L30